MVSVLSAALEAKVGSGVGKMGKCTAFEACMLLSDWSPGHPTKDGELQILSACVFDQVCFHFLSESLHERGGNTSWWYGGGGEGGCKERGLS